MATNLSSCSWKANEHFVKAYEFEKSFDALYWNNWVRDNRQWSIYMSVVYLALLYIGRKAMANRQPFSLRGLLALWNIFMALFSIAVTVRLAPFFLRKIQLATLYTNVCVQDYIIGDVPDGTCFAETFWCMVFVITKPMEFIDTLFIVLRKQHLVNWTLLKLTQYKPLFLL